MANISDDYGANPPTYVITVDGRSASILCPDLSEIQAQLPKRSISHAFEKNFKNGRETLFADCMTDEERLARLKEIVDYMRSDRSGRFKTFVSDCQNLNSANP